MMDYKARTEFSTLTIVNIRVRHKATAALLWLVAYGTALGLSPAFDAPATNVTVVAGQTIILPCAIDHLGKFKVAWLDGSNIALTYEDRPIIDDQRFSVERQQNKEWNLQVRDVRHSDQGEYRCTVNTSPVRSKLVMLSVMVPAQIIDELSSDDVTTQEGETVALVCNVTGVPTPHMAWYRRPTGGRMTHERENLGLDGELMIIQNVSRYCDADYECVATNGVGPSVRRLIRVTVEFRPEITVRTRRISQEVSKETILECLIAANPQTANYWVKDGKRLSNSAHQRIDLYEERDNHLTLSLRLHNILSTDFGDYRCVAENHLGREEQVITLYESIASEYQLGHRDMIPGVQSSTASMQRHQQRADNEIEVLHHANSAVIRDMHQHQKHLSHNKPTHLQSGQDKGYKPLPILTGSSSSLSSSSATSCIAIYCLCALLLYFAL